MSGGTGWIVGPLRSAEQAGERYTDGILSAVARVPFGELVEAASGGYEGFLDFLSEVLLGDPLLMDINYSVVGALPNDSTAGDLLILVSGDPSASWEA